MTIRHGRSWWSQGRWLAPVWWLGGLLTLVGAAVPSIVVAGSPSEAASKRIIVEAPEQSEVGARLLAELSFLGFVPTLARPSGGAESHPTAAAVITVDVAGGRVEITIIDRMTGKRVARTLRVEEPGHVDPDPREVAVRAVELLRASLLEAAEAPPPPEATVEVSPPARRALRRRPSRLAFGAAVAVGGGPGGVPVATHARVHARYMAHPRIGLLLVGNVPLHAPRVQASQGAARVRAGWLGAGPRVALRRPDALLVPDVSLTAGLAIIDLQGVPAPGYRAAPARVTDAVFEGAAGLEVAVSPRVRLRVEGAAVLCARTIRIRFAEHSVAHWCRPHALGSLGIGVLAW